MKTSIIVQNLKCGGCAKTITNRLSEINNISDIEVDTEISTVSFAYENDTDALLVKEKLTLLGYPSIENKNTMLSKAKSYVSCATGKMSI